MSMAGLCLRCMTPTGTGDECPGCGLKDNDITHDLQYAAPGTVLSGRYLLGAYLHKNGEGALYAGYDKSLQQKVWIREYYPRTIAHRALDTGKISPLAGCGAQYKALMSDFVDICNEVKRLGVTEPVVPLENVISENNTVYAIYKGLELISFEDLLEKEGGKLVPKQALALLLPICNTLGTMHTHGHIHRGVSPFTIFADKNKNLYLWDFALGATRTAGSELDAELFSGFSSPEQYSPNGWQGSWTDVYAMAALLYRTVSGIVPPKSIRIDEEHPLAPLENLVPGLPRNISEAVRCAMLPSAKDRTQTMQTFLSQIAGPMSNSTAVYDTNRITRSGQQQKQQQKNKSKGPRSARERRGGSFKYIVAGTFIMLLLLFGVIWYFIKFMYPEIIGESPSTSIGSSSVPEPSQQSAPISENRVPKFFGMRYSDVIANPEYEGKFNFSPREEFSDIFEAGIIFDQSPPEGNKISEGETTVILYISKGPTTYQMPSLVGDTVANATEALGKLEGVIVEVVTRYDAAAKPGTVVGTLPEAGVEFDPKRQTVFLFVMPEVSVVEGNSRAPEDSSKSED